MTNRIEYILGLKPKTILSLRNGWLTQSSKDEIQLCKIRLPDNGEAMPERLAKAQDCNAMKHFLLAVTRSCFSHDKRHFSLIGTTSPESLRDCSK